MFKVGDYVISTDSYVWLVTKDHHIDYWKLQVYIVNTYKDVKLLTTIFREDDV